MLDFVCAPSTQIRLPILFQNDVCFPDISRQYQDHKIYETKEKRWRPSNSRDQKQACETDETNQKHVKKRFFFVFSGPGGGGGE